MTPERIPAAETCRCRSLRRHVQLRRRPGAPDLPDTGRQARMPNRPPGGGGVLGVLASPLVAAPPSGASSKEAP